MNAEHRAGLVLVAAAVFFAWSSGCSSDDDDDDGASGSGGKAGGGSGTGGMIASGGKSGSNTGGASAGTGGGTGGSAATSAGGSGGTSGSGASGTGGSAGGGDAGAAGSSGPPPPTDAGTSVYTLDCRNMGAGNSSVCGFPAATCVGINTPMMGTGFTCSNDCNSNEDCSMAPSGSEAQAGCVQFAQQKRCVLVCQDGEIGCPTGMSCFTPMGASTGYCLWF
jgi:hypothetical protein